MAKPRLIHACSLLLLLPVILYTEAARPTKSLNSVVHFKQGKGTKHNDRWSGPLPPEHNTGLTNSVAGKPNQSIGFQDSLAVQEDAFRPTTPGSSPGVGHSSAPTKGDIKT